MKTKYFCRRCGEQFVGDYGYCPVCRENKGDADVVPLTTLKDIPSGSLIR